MSYHREGSVDPGKIGEVGKFMNICYFCLLNVLASASNYRTSILPWEPPLPELGSYGLDETDPTPELRGGHF